ncbi:MAG: CpXC domain-containing protein [Syntrophomonas sp.]
MSKEITLDAVCPNCGFHQEVQYWGSINSDLNPELKARLMEGELNSYTCQQCSELIQLGVATLYHDMTRGFMIYLLHDQEQHHQAQKDLAGFIAMLPNYRFRFVDQEIHLIEKIRIFEDGLDDRIVELIKMLILNQALEAGQPPDLVLYRGLSESEGDPTCEFIVRFRDHSEAFQVSIKDSYEPLLREFKEGLERDELNKRWLRVDSDYLLSLV